MIAFLQPAGRAVGPPEITVQVPWQLDPGGRESVGRDVLLTTGETRESSAHVIHSTLVVFPYDSGDGTRYRLPRGEQTVARNRHREVGSLTPLRDGSTVSRDAVMPATQCVGLGLGGLCGGFGGESSFFVGFRGFVVFVPSAALPRAPVRRAAPDPRVFAIGPPLRTTCHVLRVMTCRLDFSGQQRTRGEKCSPEGVQNYSRFARQFHLKLARKAVFTAPRFAVADERSCI